MAKKGGVDKGKESFWRGKIREQAESGLTISGFCRREGFSPNSFYRWRRVLAKRDRDLERGVKRSRSPGSWPGKLFAPVSVVPCREGPVPGQGFKDDDSSLSACNAQAGIEVVLGSGLMLRVRPGFDADTLLRLLSLLEDSRC
jgi:hypothetical protein